MSTQRVLLMLFVTVAVAWMVGYADGKHAADRWWQADEALKLVTYGDWLSQRFVPLIVTTPTRWPRPAFIRSSRNGDKIHR